MLYGGESAVRLHGDYDGFGLVGQNELHSVTRLSQRVVVIVGNE